MQTTHTREQLTCYHCGDDCREKPLIKDDKAFCCFGCQTVFELLEENDLCDYYSFEKNPGNQLSHFIKDKFTFLDDEKIITYLLDFQSEDFAKITFHIPSIHCSSCIWLLENIGRFDQGIIYSKINFTKKTLSVNFNPQKTRLRKVAELLYQLGYEPDISLENQTNSKPATDKKTYLKLGVAGFCFGNIMLLAFPEYLGIEVQSEFKVIFAYISLGLSLPVLLYCSSEFFVSAIAGLKKKLLNIDLPIVIGVLALFFRSAYEILSQSGAGYLDSFSALVFFLLIGRWIQNRTYQGLSFERNFKSYFPLAVQKIKDNQITSTLVEAIQVNDLIEIRNEEIIPCDAILMNRTADIDYSFVTGESAAIRVREGDKVFAGGKIKGYSARLSVIKEVSQSYLTQLWNNDTFDHTEETNTIPLIDKISQYFTPVVILIAFGAGLFWTIHDSNKVLFVISSVLIIACPCALALAAPFTLSTAMNVLGNHQLYLKGTHVIEKVWSIKKIIFDKTGTLTTAQGMQVEWVGEKLGDDERSQISACTSQSIHPLSQQINGSISTQNSKKLQITKFNEYKGKGIEATIDDSVIKIGSRNWIDHKFDESTNATQVFVSINGQTKGYYSIGNVYRPGLRHMIDQIHSKYDFAVLSGDNDQEKENLTKMFPKPTQLHFELDPQQKLALVKNDEKVTQTMMIGDGLNDAGALKASHLGISVTENMSSFTPASDMILHGPQLTQLPKFLLLMQKSKSIIVTGFILSFLYNALGLSFAVAGYVTPVFAAILMPISSISVVAFSTLSVKLLEKTLALK